MIRKDAEKNYLAFLAIPVILSMLLSFATDVLGKEVSIPAMGEEVRYSEDEESNDSKKEYSRQRLLEHAVVMGNYALFLQLTKEMPFGDIMTESAFKELVERYRLQKGGYYSESVHLEDDRG